MATAAITPTDNGPYLVEGPMRVVDADGTEYDLSEQTTIFLCRCGSSGAKPFCDGTHETLNFQATHRAMHNLSYRSSRHPEREGRSACSTTTTRELTFGMPRAKFPARLGYASGAFAAELAIRLRDVRGMTEDSGLVPGQRTWRFAAPYVAEQRPGVACGMSA